MTFLPPRAPFVLLENSRDADGLSYLFEQPVRTIMCDDPAHLSGALAAVEKARAEGLYAAGWISYEAGYVLEPRLAPLMPEERHEPLMWFGLFTHRQTLDSQALETWWRENTLGRTGALSPVELGLDRVDYVARVKRIKDYLATGDIYQANFTMPCEAVLEGDPLALHGAVRQAQPVPVGAFIWTGDWAVSSHAPELFLKKRGRHVEVQPMKGTAPRGRWTHDDDAAAAALKADPKAQAENLMIVDLERNDLSRLATPGSVVVRNLFEVVRYPTILTMVSTVSAHLKDAPGLSALMAAIFPCGSVTGAPKIRAMEIIRELEEAPRGVYTGAIGQITPDGDMTFSVPIRTLMIDAKGRARFGVGSGIVADSDPDAEYDECALKCVFLDAPQPRPALIETMLWRHDGGYWLLDDHLERLAASARYFDYPVDVDVVPEALAAFSQSFSGPEDRRVRLLASVTGAISVSATRVAPLPASPTVAFADDVMQSGDPFLFHKTTRRALYNQRLKDARARGHWDALFVNERGEVTEGARANLFAELDGVFVTPPLSSGLLPGTFRAHLMNDSALGMREQVLFPADLRNASRLFMGNALYGLVAVRLAPWRK